MDSKRENGETSTNQDKEKLLIKEYFECHYAARHHDTLQWTSSSILIAANILLIGFTIENFSQKNNLIIIIISILGTFLSLSLISFVFDFRRIKNFNYRKSEDILIELKKLKEIDEKAINLMRKKPEPGGQWGVLLSLIILLTIFWVIILIVSICSSIFLKAPLSNCL